MNSFEFGNLFDVLKDSINEDEIVDEDTDDEENIISKAICSISYKAQKTTR